MIKIAVEMFPDYPADLLQKGIRRLLASNIWPQTAVVDQGAWEAASQLRKRILNTAK